MREPTWVLIVPVKRLAAAKSRLRGAVPGVPHERLALALALDTVAAAASCAEVLVVTADPLAARELTVSGARVVPDRPDAGLNAAIAYAAGLAGAGPAGAGRRCRLAALTADLPALRPDELAAALVAAGDSGGFVADTAGTGTTLLVAAPGRSLAPRFGAGSAAAHAHAGYAPLRGAWPTLRRDVDTADDLAAAGRFGVGAHTATLLKFMIQSPKTA